MDADFGEVCAFVSILFAGSAFAFAAILDVAGWP